MYAIFESGGKQYRATPGDILTLEKLEGNPGDKLTFDKLLLVSGKDGATPQIGCPYVEKATIEAEIVVQKKGNKIRIIKYKRRKGYRRTLGHRQLLTQIRIQQIIA